jgi:hypothetical protein
MIYPRGSAVPINLRTLLPEECVAVATNRDTSLVAVITKSSLFVLQAEVSFDTKPCTKALYSVTFGTCVSNATRCRRAVAWC